MQAYLAAQVPPPRRIAWNQAGYMRMRTLLPEDDVEVQWRTSDGAVHWDARHHAGNEARGRPSRREPRWTPYPGTTQTWTTKVLVLANPSQHPSPQPVTPLVLCRVLNNGTLDIPAGGVLETDKMFADAHLPHHHLLVAGFRNVVEDTNLSPKLLGIYTCRGTPETPALERAGRPSEYLVHHAVRPGKDGRAHHDTSFLQVLGR